MGLVAHRGYPLAFPENTLVGYRQSVIRGAGYVETDVQCTQDGVPVLYHDASTRRLSGVEGSVIDRTYDKLSELSAHYPGRFADRFAGTPIPTLEMFAGWLAQHSAVTAFIEVKRVALDKFGIQPVLQRVTEAIEGVEDRCVIISFDDRCIEHAAECYGIRTGWVLSRWDAEVKSRACELAPDYLFAKHTLIPKQQTEIWQGPWQWVVYVINDLHRALSYVEQGITLIETDAVGELLDQYRAGYPQAP